MKKLGAIRRRMKTRIAIKSKRIKEVEVEVKAKIRKKIFRVVEKDKGQAEKEITEISSRIDNELIEKTIGTTIDIIEILTETGILTETIIETEIPIGIAIIIGKDIIKGVIETMMIDRITIIGEAMPISMIIGKRINPNKKKIIKLILESLKKEEGLNRKNMRLQLN